MRFLFGLIKPLGFLSLFSVLFTPSAFANLYTNIEKLEMEIEGKRISIALLHHRLQAMEIQLSQRWIDTNSIFSQLSIIYEEDGALHVSEIPILCQTRENEEIVFSSSFSRENHGCIEVIGVPALSSPQKSFECMERLSGGESSEGNDDPSVLCKVWEPGLRDYQLQTVYAADWLPSLETLDRYFSSHYGEVPCLREEHEKHQRAIEGKRAAVESTEIHFKRLQDSISQLYLNLSEKLAASTIAHMDECLEAAGSSSFYTKDLIAKSGEVVHAIRKDTDSAVRNIVLAEADHKRAVAQIFYKLWHSEGWMFSYLLENVECIQEKIRAILAGGSGRRLHTIIHHAHSRNDMCGMCDKMYGRMLSHLKATLAHQLGLEQSEFGFGSVYSYTHPFEGKCPKEAREASQDIELASFRASVPPTFFHHLTEFERCGSFGPMGYLGVLITKQQKKGLHPV